MELDRQPQINNKQKIDISSFSVSKGELRRFCEILQERANSAAEIEVGLFQQNDQSDEQYQENIVTIRESFQLKITVSGTMGEELWGPIDVVFDSVNFPEQVGSLYVDSSSTLRNVHKFYPHNSFEILLDFTKPKVLDLSLLPSHQTPNESNVEVKGYDATWVNGVFSEIKKFIDQRSSTLSVVHNHSVYDLFLWLLGFPLSFWVCSKLSTTIESMFESSSFVTSALYFYTFIAILFVFRVLFHYLRWVCPLVEFRSQRNKMIMHRALFGVLSVGWFGNFIYDIVKWIVKT
ncbi:hypothetical protein [Photobacterium sanguinicancri]|uniref:hypothetical protein n=1 Tax=Photobacterium sanguinicancri TaxID=875932 RepID=UPI000788B7AD|nr:hypothetical protein [Photobacterium sanguinicancri]KXI23212.1 hypothetical protein AS132_09090 [Photobacterium sanguinicancri]